MLRFLKRLASQLPDPVQERIRLRRIRSQIRRGTFTAGEPEYELLDRFTAPGDWAIDVGANVGHYTARLSQLVGPQGRVLAFEPVPSTFRILAANTALFEHRNVTLFQAALSDRTGTAGLVVPRFTTGLANYYGAHLGDEAPTYHIMTLRLDSIISGITRVGIIKIDAEGHESRVLEGMMGVIESNRPTLIVETLRPEKWKELAGLGYSRTKLDGSPNILLKPQP